MKCEICKMVAEFTCTCRFPILCPVHLSSHLKQPDHEHKIELLDVTLGIEESEKLKLKVLGRIVELETSKKEIILLSKNLIKNFKNCRREAILKLDKELQIYFKFMSLENLSISLKAKLETILASALIIKKGFADPTPAIEEAFSLDLIYAQIKEDQTEVEKDKRQLEERSQFEAKEKINIETKFREEKDKKIAEVRKKEAYKKVNKKKIKKRESKETEERKNQVNKQLEFLDSLNISQFVEKFGKGNSLRGKVSEVLLSNDKIFSFICKIYSGIFK